MRLPHDDIIIALQRRLILMSRRASTLRIDHVIELLLVGTDPHSGGILAFLREHGEESGVIARGLGFTILHAPCEHARELCRGELEVEQRADGDAAFGALVEGGGAEGDGGGEGHAPESDGIRVDNGEGAEEGESVGVVGGLLDGIDIVARGAVAQAEAAGVVDEGRDVGELVLLGDFGDEHFFDAIELCATCECLIVAFCGVKREVLAYL